jgi:hypothetical protein
MKHFLTLLLFASLGTARAETTDELIEQLKAAVKAEAKTARDNNDGATQQRFYQLQQLLLQLSRSNTDGQGEYNLTQTIEAIGSIVSSDKVEEICRNLAPQLRAESEKREATLAEEMKKGLADALRAGLAGKTVKELDAPMVAVSRLLQESNNRQTNNPKLRNLNSQAQQLWEYLRQWQDYLADSQNGNTQGARQKLQNLLGSGRDFSAFIPRSELLERLAVLQKQEPTTQEPTIVTAQEFNEKARGILQNIKSLEDLPTATEQLEALLNTRRAGNSSEFQATTLNTLRTFQRVYFELKKGGATNISLNTITASSGFETNEVVASLRNELVLFALPRILGLPETDPPKPGENAGTYLTRIMRWALEKSNWTVLGRTIDIAQTLNVGTTSVIADRTALQSFLAALNQERAKQYALAVSSFQSSLKTGSQIISPEIIGEHLEAIRKDHPAEFEEGVRLALNPPLPVDGRGYTVDPRTGRLIYGPGGYFPGSTPPRPTPESTSIAIPAIPDKTTNTPPPVATPAPPAAVPKAN